MCGARDYLGESESGSPPQHSVLRHDFPLPTFIRGCPLKVTQGTCVSRIGRLGLKGSVWGAEMGVGAWLLWRGASCVGADSQVCAHFPAALGISTCTTQQVLESICCLLHTHTAVGLMRIYGGRQCPAFISHAHALHMLSCLITVITLRLTIISTAR